jgi:endonuclease/exonuclease/phosphatase family metal-dependent hydrolase
MEDKMNLKVITWNMNYWQRSESQRAKAWDFLNSLNVDIAILQETKPYFNCMNNHYVFSQKFPVKDSWGSAIITKNYNSYKHSFLSTYVGSEGLMCYDFEIEKNNIVTIINCYGKIDFNGESTTTMHHMLSDITPIVWGKPKNLIIMAGDLNSTVQWDEIYKNKNTSYKLVFDRIEDMGLINCTMKQFGEHRQTFVRENTFPYQDDWVFIKGEKNTWDVKILNDKEILDYSDHYPIELNIEI